MPRQRSKQQFVPFILGLALAWSVCVSLLGADSFGFSLGDAASLDLSALAHTELVLMSCDHEAGAAYSALGAADSGESPEPLWCENPDSPHCLPGNRAPSRHDPWMGPLSAFSSTLFAAASSHVWSVPSAWPAPRVAELVSKATGFRLERPPRLG